MTQRCSCLRGKTKNARNAKNTVDISAPSRIVDRHDQGGGRINSGIPLIPHKVLSALACVVNERQRCFRSEGNIVQICGNISLFFPLLSLAQTGLHPRWPRSIRLPLTGSLDLLREAFSFPVWI